MAMLNNQRVIYSDHLKETMVDWPIPVPADRTYSCRLREALDGNPNLCGLKTSFKDEALPPLTPCLAACSLRVLLTMDSPWNAIVTMVDLGIKNGGYVWLVNG